MNGITYLAGKMGGEPEFNYPKFNAKADELRQLGFHIMNPAENPTPNCKSWEGFMRLGISQLVQCDNILLLEKWSQSNGATWEYEIAKRLKMNIYFESLEAEMEESLWLSR